MKKVRICGVPEHFNLPWHFAIEEGAFEERGIELQWTDVPEGTGKMANMLNNHDIDMAVILTEGIIKSISQGNPSSIVQTFIDSPLLWGIHVDTHSDFKEIADLKEKKAAISRYGSGSHLMAIVHAQINGWDTEKLGFEQIHTLEGAITALRDGEADYFMWERFTTKPLVDNGTFRHLGNCPTPWPCFVIAANNEFLQSNQQVLRHILEIINIYTVEFKKIPSIDRTLAIRYDQQLVDIKEWLSITEWSQRQLSNKVVETVIDHLESLGLLEEVEMVRSSIWKG